MSFLTSPTKNQSPSKTKNSASLFGGYDSTRSRDIYTKSKQTVNAESAKTIATAYRAKNILGNDLAKIPLQHFRRINNEISQIQPDPNLRNISYLLEIQPNRWMIPFIFKKTLMEWIIFWGNAYVWRPIGGLQELFILPASTTVPKLDANGNKVYEVTFPNGMKDTLPDVEVMHVMINSTNGRVGKSVLEYAAETLGKQLAAYSTQNQIHGDGVKAAVVMQMAGSLKAEDRDRVREEYKKSLSEPGSIAVIDNKVVKYDQIGMKLTDAQFLESIQATDRDIANFFEMPEYKLNMGKQSYESNTQQKLDYLETTLDPFLVQMEQAARVKWLPFANLSTDYFKFNREAFLRTDAKSRAELYEIRIRNGTMTPNEAKAIEDENGYEQGGSYWMTRNNAPVNELINPQPKVNVNVGERNQ
jgi:HK97 family phage portal protein